MVFWSHFRTNQNLGVSQTEGVFPKSSKSWMTEMSLGLTMVKIGVCPQDLIWPSEENDDQAFELARWCPSSESRSVGEHKSNFTRVD